LAGYIPVRNHDASSIPACILLDGLDDVLFMYESAMMMLLRGLLSLSSSAGFVQKVVLTTRPLLEEIIETEFKVKAYNLVLLSDEEQINYLVGEMKYLSPYDAGRKLEKLPESVSDLISNPLMLHIYSQVCPGSSYVLDLFSLYTLLEEKKYELYLMGKEKLGLGCMKSGKNMI